MKEKANHREMPNFDIFHVQKPQFGLNCEWPHICWAFGYTCRQQTHIANSKPKLKKKYKKKTATRMKYNTQVQKEEKKRNAYLMAIESEKKMKKKKKHFTHTAHCTAATQSPKVQTLGRHLRTGFCFSFFSRSTDRFSHPIRSTVAAAANIQTHFVRPGPP